MRYGGYLKTLGVPETFRGKFTERRGRVNTWRVACYDFFRPWRRFMGLPNVLLGWVLILLPICIIRSDDYRLPSIVRGFG